MYHHTNLGLIYKHNQQTLYPNNHHHNTPIPHTMRYYITQTDHYSIYYQEHNQYKQLDDPHTNNFIPPLTPITNPIHNIIINEIHTHTKIKINRCYHFKQTINIILTYKALPLTIDLNQNNITLSIYNQKQTLQNEHLTHTTEEIQYHNYQNITHHINQLLQEL